jgi:hypothetical protein
MVTMNGRSPQQSMRQPQLSALDKPGPEGGIEDCQGMMEKAEPVLT